MRCRDDAASQHGNLGTMQYWNYACFSGRVAPASLVRPEPSKLGLAGSGSGSRGPCLQSPRPFQGGWLLQPVQQARPPSFLFRAFGCAPSSPARWQRSARRDMLHATCCTVCVFGVPWTSFEASGLDSIVFFREFPKKTRITEVRLHGRQR